MKIQDHVFIVTGASSGIGLSTAEALAQKGAKVVLLARTKSILEELSKKLPGSLPLVADIDQRSVEPGHDPRHPAEQNAARRLGIAAFDIKLDRLAILDPGRAPLAGTGGNEQLAHVRR